MSVTIEQDLKEYLDQKFKQFDQRFENIEQSIGKIDDRLNKLEVGQARLEERLTGEIKILDEKLTGEIKTLAAKVDGISKRLDSQEFVSRGVLVGLIVAVVGGAAKLFGLVGNP